MGWSWAFANLKPGTGKTTTAVLFAHALHYRDRQVLLVDADPGESASRWGELAGGFPMSVVTLHKRTLLAELRSLLGRLSADVDVVLDLPQLEDHAAIARGGLAFADTWVCPVAPSGIEVDRMVQVGQHFAEVQATRETPADEVVLFNRANRAHPTLTGPDNRARSALTGLGYHVLRSMIPHADDRFRQCFGVPVDPDTDPAIDRLTSELLGRCPA